MDSHEVVEPRDGSSVIVRPVQPEDGVGVARYIRPHSSTDAEASAAVIDAWQGRGPGGVLELEVGLSGRAAVTAGPDGPRARA